MPPLTRFGLRLPTAVAADARADPLAWLSERARAAESAGFDSLWVADRPADVLDAVPAAADRTGPLEAYTVLGALAMRTERVRLGALVTAVDARSPSIVSKQVTALDRLSGGRAVLGLGAGAAPRPGQSPPPTAGRFDALEDALRICRAMLGSEPASVEGRVHRVAGAANRPSPLQDRLPIVVGGGDEERTLPLAVALADGCNLTGSPDLLRRELDRIGELCEVHARDRAGFSVTALVVPETGDPRAAAAALAPVLGAGVDGLVLDVPATMRPDDIAALGAALVDVCGPAER